MASELFGTSFINDANLEAYYRLENVNDSRASFTLTNFNSVTFTTAKFGNGANQGASNTNKYLGISNNLGISGNCTFNIWINITTDPGLNGQVRILTHQNVTTHVRHSINYEDTSGVKTITFNRVRQGTSSATVSMTQTLGTGVWHMLTFTYDGSNIFGYLDGGSAVTVASSGSGASGLADLFYIGMHEDGSSIPTSAVTDDVAVFSRALSASEVLSLYLGGTGLLGKYL